jgi:hypothetical protein
MTQNPFDSDPLEPPPEGFQPSAAAPPPTAPHTHGQPYPEPSDPYGQAVRGGQADGGPPHGGRRRTNHRAVAALVLGIVSVVCLPLVTSIIAIVLGGSARKRIAQSGDAGAGMAKAGRIVGIVSLVLSGGFIVHLGISRLFADPNLWTHVLVLDLSLTSVLLAGVPGLAALFALAG